MFFLLSSRVFKIYSVGFVEVKRGMWLFVYVCIYFSVYIYM